jgi:CRP/FNR family transcriptional regulator
MLSIIDRIIFLKEVPFFQGMTIDQLKILAALCEEKFFEKDAHIFNNGDSGGVLYVVVNGRVGIEQEKRAGSFARLADVDAYSYFGEANFFDNSPRSMSAVAIRDSLILQLRREPMIELTRQNPNLALELINVLSERLRASNMRVAELTRPQTDQLDKLYNKFG